LISPQVIFLKCLLSAILCFCIQDLAIDATTTAGVDLGQGMREVDIKKYIKVEKVPGGQLEDSRVLKGVMFNKDVVAPGKMKRKIVNPRIILLDCPVEYKKGENQTNAELMKEEVREYERERI
jgi:T-complex protein 1 subunit gamma